VEVDWRLGVEEVFIIDMLFAMYFCLILDLHR
jgi:hypothetical protein